MKSRTYQLGDYLLVTGSLPTITKDGLTHPDSAGYDPTNPDGNRLRKPDLRLFQFMVVESHRQKDREFTQQELWLAGWDDTARAGKTQREIANSVQPAVSRLRNNFPGLLPSKGYRLLLPVFDVTPLDPPMLVAHRVFIGCTVTVIATILIDTPTRAILTACGWTLTQPHLKPPLGFVLGAFQGEIGALLYSLPIVASLLTLWFVVYGFEPWKARYPKLVGSLVGGVSGAFGGLLVTIALLYAQSISTLEDADWISHGSGNRWEAFSVTRFGYAMPWFGFVAGAGVAWTVMSIVRRPQWREFLTHNTSLTNPRVALEVLVALFKIGTGWCLAFVVPEMLASALVFKLLVSRQAPIARIVGESMVVAVGGIAFVGGLLTALYSLTKGADIEADQDCSLVP